MRNPETAPLAAIERLPPEQQRILELVAVADDELTQTAIGAAYASVAGRAGDRIPTVTGMKALVGTLRAGGWLTGADRAGVPQPHAEQLVRKVAREGRYRELVEAVAAAEPLEARSMRHWARPRAGTAARELRRSVYLADESRFRDLYPRYGSALQLFDWLTGPLESDIIRSQVGPLTALMLDALSMTRFSRLEPVPGLLELIRDRAEAHPRVRMIQVVLAREELLAGELERAEATLRLLDPGEDAFLFGWYALIRGDVKAATKHYAAALASVRKRVGNGPFWIAEAEAFFLPLTYLLHGTDSRTKQALTFIRNTRKAAVIEHLSRFVGYEHLERLVDPTASDARLAHHAVAVLMQALVHRWTDSPQPDRALAIAAAENCGYAWVAAELCALGEGTGSVPGAVALWTHRAQTPVWESLLDALSEVVAGGSDAKPQQTKRLAWFVGADPLEIEAREQSWTRGSWSAGRKVAMERLAGQRGDLDIATEADRQVLGCLRSRTYRGWSGYPETSWSWQEPDTWVALAGHPAVFALDGDPLEVVLTRPVLSVKPDKGGVRLELTPHPDGKPVRVYATQPNRVEVTVFGKDQLRIADILGRGLQLPAGAKDKLSTLLPRLTRELDVHDATSLSSAAAATVEADPRPVVQLTPQGGTLSVRIVVRPLGPGGPDVIPGEGPITVWGRIDEQPRCAVRSLEEEALRLTELERQAPAVVAAADGELLALDDPELALEALLELQQLTDRVHVEWPDGERLRLRSQVDGKALSVAVKSVGDWFGVSGSLQVDDDLVLDLGELLRLTRDGVGRFVRLASGEFLALTDALRRQLDALSRASRTRGKSTELHRLTAAGVLDPLIEAGAKASTDKGYRAYLKRTAELAKLDVSVPAGLRADLRPYQEDGYAWLLRLAHLGAGACLADDMGLGKTVQTLALILARSGGPTLVVAPTSVCGGWVDEAWRFAPTLRVHRFGEGDRQAVLDGLGPGDLVVCSYGLLVSEAERLAAVRWHTVVLDEAQAIKNAATQRHKAAVSLQADFRVALTGTPLENRLEELWALFGFLDPEMLGTAEGFRKRFVLPIDGGDREVQRQLRRLIKPLLLRRTKAEVLQDLPPRTEITVDVELGAEEAALYEALRRDAVGRLAEGEIKPLQVLAELTRLRLACCNPRLVLEDGAPPSAKLEAFAEIVERLVEGGHRALVFSQFTRHLALLREWLDSRGIAYLYLDGSTPGRERDRLVASFQAGEGTLFLISLRAGGSGLNLTGADYVVHMDPWWNPAVEDQASDRAHRIGQSRPVTVYRLVARGTVEERIVALHHQKRDLADRLLDGTGEAARLSADQLLAILQEGSATM